jgi:hypothetical protein
MQYSNSSSRSGGSPSQNAGAQCSKPDSSAVNPLAGSNLCQNPDNAVSEPKTCQRLLSRKELLPWKLSLDNVDQDLFLSIVKNHGWTLEPDFLSDLFNELKSEEHFDPHQVRATQLGDRDLEITTRERIRTIDNSVQCQRVLSIGDPCNMGFQTISLIHIQSGEQRGMMALEIEWDQLARQLNQIPYDSWAELEELLSGEEGVDLPEIFLEGASLKLGKNMRLVLTPSDEPESSSIVQGLSNESGGTRSESVPESLRFLEADAPLLDLLGAGSGFPMSSILAEQLCSALLQGESLGRVDLLSLLESGTQLSIERRLSAAYYLQDVDDYHLELHDCVVLEWEQDSTRRRITLMTDFGYEIDNEAEHDDVDDLFAEAVEEHEEDEDFEGAEPWEGSFDEGLDYSLALPSSLDPEVLEIHRPKGLELSFRVIDSAAPPKAQWALIDSLAEILLLEPIGEDLIQLPENEDSPGERFLSSNCLLFAAKID